MNVPVTVHIPGALREFTAGRSTVDLAFSHGTVADLLSALWSIYPGVRDRVVNEQGQLRQHINIFIGNENIRYTGGLTSSVSEGAEITIVPAVSGGSSYQGVSSDTPQDARKTAEFAKRRHPEGPRFLQRAEGSRVQRTICFARDPSLRLKNGCAQDDASKSN